MITGMKKPNEYVRFRPYKAIGTTRSNWRRSDGFVRTMVNTAMSALIYVGVPSLIIVPAVVYYLAGFQDWGTFLGHTLATFLFPLGAILVIAVGSGAIAFWRTRIRG